MNNCSFIGRLTTDPELKTTQSGVSVCSFTLAVKRPRVSDTTDFINFTAWRQAAEYISMYGKKGNLLEVSGSLTQRKYQDKDGNNRSVYEIICDTVGLLENKRDAEGAQDPTESKNTSQNSHTPLSAEAEASPAPTFTSLNPDDDLPF